MTPERSSDSISLSDWKPTASGQAQLRLSSGSRGRTAALQMDFDFKGGEGFLVARRDVNRPMPEDYALHLRLRGHGAVNHFEVKLVDAGGQNVWRHVRKNLKLPERWISMKISSRDMEFAWGPAGGGSPAQLGAIELAIVAGEGGSGTIWISDLSIQDCTPTEAPTASASSELPGFEAAQALQGTGWRPRAEDPDPWLVVDSHAARTLGGLIIDWREQAPASGFRVRGSNNGERWKTLHSARRAGGTRSYVFLPNTKTRFLRLEFKEASAGARLRLQSFEFSRSIHAFWHAVAAGEPRGWHPRWLHREQSLWTPIGTSNGEHCALMNGDGMVEVDQGSFSIEPMLWIDNRLFTWTDVDSRQELLDQWMPVPSVIWETGDWRLHMQTESTVGGARRVHYRLENLTQRVLSARLFVLIRPFQVTPPWQSFRNLGGVSRIHDLAWRNGAVQVNQTLLIVPLVEPASFGAMRFDEGFIASHLAAGELPPAAQVHDAFGFASAALRIDLQLQAGQIRQSIVACVPLGAQASAEDPAFDWRGKIPAGQWAGNGWITDAVHASLTAISQVLITRSGAALQPGPRRYTRSWIRDGAMMSAALLRMGRQEEVRDFIRWYAPYQRADGFVPCCVDAQGPDWLVEHDSHAQLIALIADYYRFSSDASFLEESWTFIERAVGCIEGLLDDTGLLPISVSHEGYLAQPVHSYWDDFWTLRGLRDAASLARTLRHEASAQRWQALTERFSASLFASIEATRAQHTLDFIPGSIEWADFDPTATANAIALLDVPEGLDRRAVEQTFDKYLADWRSKRSGELDSPSYTPYEIRIIGALVRLGRRDAALELLRFFLSDRRPPAWNQWPEIAWRDQHAPAHLGDLPHTWVAAEYVLALRSMFAYEREADQALVLAAGLAPEWIEGAGVQVNGMPTLYGSLSYSLRRIDAETLRFEIAGSSAAKIILRPPLPGALRSVIVNGSQWTAFDEDSVTFPHNPLEVICTTVSAR